MTIQTNHSIDTIISTITGVELVSGLQSAFANANAAFAEANGFQSIINSVFTLANSTTNLVTGAYSNANAAFAEANAFQSIINSAFALVNTHSTSITSVQNLIVGAYANANAALAEANAFQSIINSAFALTNSTTNLVTSAYGRANAVVQNQFTYISSNSITTNAVTLLTVVGNNTVLLSANQGNLTQQGIVQLSDSVLSTSIILGATANAVNTVWATAQAAFAQANSAAGGGLSKITDYMTGTLTVNNLTSNVGINTGIIVANTRLAVVGIDIGSGLASVYASTNSTTNLVIGAYALANSDQNLIAGAYANANAALAEANAFQNIINSSFSLTNSTTNLVTSAYNRANAGGAINSVNVGGTYVLSSNDNGTIICFNNTNPLNVNTSVLNTAPGAVGAGLAGFRVIITQSNTGMVTIIQGPSTLLLPRVTGNNSIVSQNASVSLFVPTSNTFLLDGSIAGTPSSPGGGGGGGGGLQNTTDYMTGTLTVNNLTSNVGINTGIIIANTRLAVVGIDIGSGLASAYSSVNSTSNLIVGAYANANAAFAEANAFQSIINSAFTLANTAVQRATDVMSGVLTVPALTSTGGVNTGIIVANTTIRATGNVIGGNLVTTGVVNSKTVIVNTVNVGGTYVLDANDSGTVICFNNATAVTVNTSSVNTGGTVVGAGFTGFRVLLTQVNTGMVTVQAGPGTTLLPRITGNNSISSQNGSMSLMVWSSNVYLMDGALSGNITTAPIVDTLVSTVITSALSANMGNFISNRDVSKAGDVMNGMLTVLGLQSNGQIIVNSLSCNTEANVTGNIFTSGPTSYIAAQTAIGITAAGIAQGTATALTRQINIITTCAGGANGVLLPIPPVGTEISVSNFGATACSVWPPSTHGIDSLGLNSRANCAPSGFRRFVRANAIHWYTTANGIFTGP